MFEHFDTPQDAYQFKLGATLTMEQTVIEILDANIAAAQAEDIKAALRAHRQETQAHIENVEEVFSLFGWDVDKSPCPAIDGLQAEGAAMLKKTNERIIDSVILQGCVEVEHHEIGVYQNLILNAGAMGRQDVVELLTRNLQNEETTLELVLSAQERVAAKTPEPAATL